VAGVEAVVGVGLSVSTNLMSSDLPSWLGWLLQDGRSWVVGGLFLASAVVLTLRGDRRQAPETCPDGEASLGSAPAAVQVSGRLILSGSGADLRRPGTAETGQGSGLAAGVRCVVGDLPAAASGYTVPGDLDRVREFFSTVGPEQGRVCVLTGGRGVGKTQIAGAYARAEAGTARVVIWVSGETPDGLLAGLASAARRLGAATDVLDSVTAAGRLRGFLEGLPGKAVLVVDDAGDPATLMPLLPATGGTEVLVTSNDRRFTGLGTWLDVGGFTRQESLSYLRARTGLDDEPGANAVAQELGDLPVALAQAATVIVHRHLTYPRYLELLRERGLSVGLPPDPANPYRRPTAEAVLLSLQTLEDADPSGQVGVALTGLALLSPDGVSRELLTSLWADRMDADDVESVLSELNQACLVTWADDRDSVRMHRVVGRVIRERAADGRQLGTELERVAAALESMLPADDQAWQQRDLGQELVAHIIAVTQHAHDARAEAALVAACARLGQWTLAHLRETAELRRALDLGHAWLNDDEPLFDPSAAGADELRAELAAVHREAGHHQTALELFTTVLRYREQLLGPHHLDTLAAKEGLALTLEAAGRPLAACDLLDTVITERQQTLGSGHRDTLRSRLHLLDCHWFLGHRPRVADLAPGLVADCTSALGADDPLTLRARERAFWIAWQRGDRDHACAGLQHLLDDHIRVFGADHPRTLGLRCNGILILHSTWRSRRTRSEQSQLALTAQHQVLEADHPDLLQGRLQLVGSLWGGRWLPDVIALLSTCAQESERLLGAQSPTTLETWTYLAIAQVMAGRPFHAARMMAEIRTVTEQTCDPTYWLTMSVRHGHALAVSYTGRGKQACDLYTALLEQVSGTSGPGCRPACVTRLNLAWGLALRWRLPTAFALAFTNRRIVRSLPLSRTAAGRFYRAQPWILAAGVAVCLAAAAAIAQVLMSSTWPARLIIGVSVAVGVGCLHPAVMLLLSGLARLRYGIAVLLPRAHLPDDTLTAHHGHGQRAGIGWDT
jgi:hypothetical protein